MIRAAASVLDVSALARVRSRAHWLARVRRFRLRLDGCIAPTTQLVPVLPQASGRINDARPEFVAQREADQRSHLRMRPPVDADHGLGIASPDVEIRPLECRIESEQPVEHPRRERQPRIFEFPSLIAAACPNHLGMRERGFTRISVYWVVSWNVVPVTFYRFVGFSPCRGLLARGSGSSLELLARGSKLPIFCASSEPGAEDGTLVDSSLAARSISMRSRC
ncbi:hypothetical protein B7760_02039 [Burkholderia glumae]|nr:hypothetical protein B7760_02039 [Burkholderia glumae]